MKQFSVLVVDDEPRILNFLSFKLRVSGYNVLTASNGGDALEAVQAEEPDLVVLDVMMPQKDGFETLKELRAFSKVPVIMLSAKGANTDKVKGLTLGADDYLAKLFSPDELIARIEAVRRRLAPSEERKAQEQLSLGEVTIDFQKRLVTVRGEEVRLTRIEWLLINELAQNAGNLMFYSDLLTRLWGPEYRDDVQILRTWVSRLRAKIESDPDNPKLIRTIPKVGYILDQPTD
ncbi:MAG: response regulator transcription factor [Chloroflexi bacterium]|nr:response regulator transcription factor [Chloroflexota bacterium]